jgi:hypothetical protein
LEKEFEPMMKLGTIQDMDDMKLNKSDFIIEHNRNSKLTDYYQMDDSAKVLGQGSFGLVQSCIHKATG